MEATWFLSTIRRHGSKNNVLPCSSPFAHRSMLLHPVCELLLGMRHLQASKKSSKAHLGVCCLCQM